MIKKLMRSSDYIVDGSLPRRLLSKWNNFRKNQIESEKMKEIKRKELVWGSLKEEKTIYDLSPQVKMHLYSDDVLSKIIFCEEYEWDERGFLNLFLKPGDTFVDIGANIGLYSLIAAGNVGIHGHVFSFEPIEKTYSRLLQNVQLNNFSNVTCIKMALSDNKADTRMKVSVDGHNGWDTLVTETAGDNSFYETVMTDTLDNLLNQKIIPENITMIKIDVEGWEAHVLNGGKNLLSKLTSPILQVEFGEKEQNIAGSTCEKLYRMLESFGFKMYHYDGKKRKLLKSPFHETTYYWENLYCIKPSGYLEQRLKIFLE